jgi:hypothetical protein
MLKTYVVPLLIECQGLSTQIPEIDTRNPIPEINNRIRDAGAVDPVIRDHHGRRRAQKARHFHPGVNCFYTSKSTASLSQQPLYV